MVTKSIQRCLLVGAVLFAGTACVDMEIENVNEPDRLRALAQAGDLESLLGGAHEVWFQEVINQTEIAQTMGVMGPVLTEVGAAAIETTEEPRRSFRTDDSPGGPAQYMAQLWRAAHQVASSAHDYMRTAEELGFTFTEGGLDVSQRHRAYAKLMQGMGWGYQVVAFDLGIFLPESVPVAADPTAQAAEYLKPWQEGIQLAVGALEEAIAIAEQNPFPAFPNQSQTRLWFGTPESMSRTTFIQLANTMAARFLVEVARTPADRAATDWNRVLAFTEKGLTTDFEVVISPGIRESGYLARIQNNAPGCTGCVRLRYHGIGPADISGAYQNWLSQDIGQRDRFDIVTPDRRITGSTPQSAGAYVAWFADNNGFDSSKGHYRRSAYQWRRHLHEGFQVNTGTMKLATVDENNLLRAEALIHLGRLDEAAQLINISRTRSHRLPDGITYPGLPPVTAAGVTQSADCVPRADNGACGDLLVALRYERTIELIGLGPVRQYSDFRGFGMLPEGTPIQFPIIASDLEAMNRYDLLGYTFGGVGTEFGATYAPVTLSNFK